MLRKLKDIRRLKPRAPPPAAVLQVFAIPELLEEILVYLPLETLFAIQRVNKTFHDTIATSERLKRKMFLQFHTSGIADARPDAENLINPLLKSHFRKQGYGASWFIFHWYDYGEKKWNHLQTANSSLADVSQMRNRKLKNAWGWKDNYIPYETIHVRTLPSDRGESWKKTNLTAVPCIVDADFGVTTMQRGYSRSIRFLAGTGTLGEFEKCVKDFVSMTDDEHMERHDRRVVRYVWRGPGNLEPVHSR